MKLNDTGATLLTAFTGSSFLFTLAEIQPLVSFVVGILGIISGVLAIRYYVKRINKLDGKG